MMIRLFFILICVLGFQNGDTEMSWHEDYKLTWDDFRGEPKQLSDAVATTASGITFSYAVKKTSAQVIDFETSVVAYFYPDKSWYKPEQVDNHVLSHEQLHFDITELHSRFFRQQIAAIKPSQTLNTQLDQLHLDINTALKKMQKRYDAESNFSRDFEQQAKWQDYIENELSRLSKFKLKN